MSLKVEISVPFQGQVWFLGGIQAAFEIGVIIKIEG